MASTGTCFGAPRHARPRNQPRQQKQASAAMAVSDPRVRPSGFNSVARTEYAPTGRDVLRVEEPAGLRGSQGCLRLLSPAGRNVTNFSGDWSVALGGNTGSEEEREQNKKPRYAYPVRMRGIRTALPSLANTLAPTMVDGHVGVCVSVDGLILSIEGCGEGILSRSGHGGKLATPRLCASLALVEALSVLPCGEVNKVG